MEVGDGLRDHGGQRGAMKLSIGNSPFKNEEVLEMKIPDEKSASQ